MMCCYHYLHAQCIGRGPSRRDALDSHSRWCKPQWHNWLCNLDVRCCLSKYQAEGNGNLLQVQVLQHQCFRIQCFTSLWEPLHPAHWALLNHAYLSAHILCGTPMMIPSKKKFRFFCKTRSAVLMSLKDIKMAGETGFLCITKKHFNMLILCLSFY